MTRTAVAIALAAAAVPTAVASLTPAAGSPPLHAARTQSTKQITHSDTGGMPNGASTNPVISGDRRYARIIAFESEASNLVRGDTNGMKDVFAIRRGGSFVNDGSPWNPGETILVSRGRGGEPANGPSYAPAVDGNFRNVGRCVAFLSAASNLVKGDTNGKVDAFFAKPGDPPTRVSLPGNRQSTADATGVAISGDCTKTAFVAGGRLYSRAGGRTHRIKTAGNPADPSFAAGETNDLVFGAKGGAYISSDATGPARLVAPGGSNPAYNGIRRHVIAYERRIGGHVQIAWRDLGHGENIASADGGHLGNHGSHDPVVENSGFYIGFESDATNLGASPGPQAYLYTDVRKMSQVRSVDNSGDPLPGGARHPGVSFYANYIVFSSPAPLGRLDKPDQIFMRYLGGA
jgi:hypothetical protein